LEGSVIQALATTLEVIGDSILTVLFGSFDHHLVDETHLGNRQTEKGYRYQLVRGRYIRCRQRFFPLLKQFPFYGKSGWQFTTYNRVLNKQVTYTTTNEEEIESTVDTSNQLTIKQLMEGEF
jgi:hypothetical protein